MNESNGQELDRILRLVEAGKISADEGERLIASLEARQQTTRCPYCAETIPAASGVCPECASRLPTAGFEQSGTSTRPSPGLAHLTGLGKFLVIFTFVATVWVILSNVAVVMSPAGVVRVGLAAVGLTAAILICKDHPAGWGLGMVWAGLQIIRVTVAGHVLNLQFLPVSINWTWNGSGLGVNLTGIVLLILFVVAARRQDTGVASARPDRYVREVVR